MNGGDPSDRGEIVDFTAYFAGVEYFPGNTPRLHATAMPKPRANSRENVAEGKPVLLLQPQFPSAFRRNVSNCKLGCMSCEESWQFHHSSPSAVESWVMQSTEKATRIQLFQFNTPAMRAFHLAWMAFFLCFFAWFAIAPLMTVVREELQLNKDQIGWCMIGSVAVTVIARLIMGWACDRYGPRLAYGWLLMLGSLPLVGISFAYDFQSFLLFRVLIGGIGASFVITQFHMSVMFAPNCVGTANATTAGWGNLGGGVTQMVMPLIFALLATVFGLSSSASWRVAMSLTGVMCFIAGLIYMRFTQDTPAGNFAELRAAGLMPPPKATRGSFWEACCNHRVWALAGLYAACFGIELVLNNVAVLYLVDSFEVLKSLPTAEAMKMAGLIAGICGSMNLFARALGGYLADRWGAKWGLAGRVKWLFLLVFAEGLVLMLFAQSGTLWSAVPALLVLTLLIAMACGATFAVVPFISKRGLGAISGIVGAGGNIGAVSAGFLFKLEGLDWSTALFLLGALVTSFSFLSFAVTFSPAAELEARRSIEAASAPVAVPAELATATS